MQTQNSHFSKEISPEMTCRNRKIRSLAFCYRGVDKSLARPGRKQARKHVGNARDFNNIETRAVIKFPPPPLQGKAQKEIHVILTQTLACSLPGGAKDLSAPLYLCITSALTTAGFSGTSAKQVSARLYGATFTRRSSSACPTVNELNKMSENLLCKEQL
jgi:hypothetical protein